MKPVSWKRLLTIDVNRKLIRPIKFVHLEIKERYNDQVTGGCKKKKKKKRSWQGVETRPG